MCRAVRSGYLMWMLIVMLMLTACAPALGPGEVVPLQQGEALRGWDMAYRGVAETIKATKDGAVYMFWPTAKDASGARLLWGRVCIQGACNRPQLNGAVMDTDTLKQTLASLSAAGYTIKIYLYGASKVMGDVPILIYSEDMIEQLEWKLPES